MYICKLYITVLFFPSQTLEKFLDQMPKNDSYQQKMLAMYLGCSGYTDGQNFCLDRVVCEYSTNEDENGGSGEGTSHAARTMTKEDKNVISM